MAELYGVLSDIILQEHLSEAEHYYFPHFTDLETETQRHYFTEGQYHNQAEMLVFECYNVWPQNLTSFPYNVFILVRVATITDVEHLWRTNKALCDCEE